MNVKKSHLVLTVLLIASVIALINLYIKIPEIKDNLEDNIKKSNLRSINLILKNFERHIQTALRANPDAKLEELLSSDTRLKESFESELNILVSNDVKYVFMVYRDEKSKYRFLLDGATQDKAKLGRKFDVTNDAWNSAYSSFQPQMIEYADEDVRGLWLTYVMPIMMSGKVVGAVAVDLSFENQRNIVTLIKPLRQALIVIFGLIALILLVALVEYLLYFFSQKRVYIDGLTNIENRQFLNELLPTLDFQKYHIAMIDIDKFKLVNDTYGHGKGDEVLKLVAEVLKNALRDKDVLARYGGEEFILLVPFGKMNQSEALVIMERLRSSVAEIVIETDTTPITPKVSIGVNLNTKESENVHDAIKTADKKLYEAKKQGRNRVVYFD